MAKAWLTPWWRDLQADLTRNLIADPPCNPVAARALWLAVLALGLLGLGLWVSGGYQTGFRALNTWSQAYPSWLWQHLTLLGDEAVVFTLTLFFARRHPRVVWSLICAAVIGALYARGLKPLIDAARPPAVLEAGSFQLIGPGHRHDSFPSGHSVTAGVWFGVLVYYARWGEWRLLFVLLALLAGLSRVALGVHWPIDVAAGLAGGGLAAWLGVELARRWRWGLTHPGVHLALVALGAGMAVTLLLESRGYPAAFDSARLLAAGALLFGVLTYLVRPLIRLWRS